MIRVAVLAALGALLVGCGGETAPSSGGGAATACHDEEFREELYPHVECDPGAHISRDEDAGIVLCRCGPTL